MRNSKYIYLATVIAIIFLCRCNVRKPLFSNDVRVLRDEFEISDTIKGDKLAITGIYSISSIICFDEYLLVLTPRANKVFNVLSFNGEIVSQFGTIGRTNDEIVNCQYNGQTEKIGSDNCVWIHDMSKSRMVLIDVDQSIRNGKMVIIKEINTSSTSVFCFRANDSVFISEQLIGNNYELLKHNLLSNTYSSNLLYNNDAEDAFSLFKTIWRFDSNRNRMVGVMQSLNQINFYSLDDQQRYSIVIGEQCTEKDKIIDAETGLERKTTFCDLEMTDSSLYALYMNQDYKDAYEKSKPQEILIFDSDGKLNRVIRLNEYIIDIAISVNGEILYGITPYDEIYSYKLRCYGCD